MIPQQKPDADVDRQAGPKPVSAPTIALPKGGGAIRGIGEKFAANPVTGTSSMSVPIATSPGRSGFGPQLSLSYDSGAGNGPFGLGWSLSLPSITRKTDKGLPLYRDSGESDEFILSGAEDLVPVPRPATANDPPGYTVQRYRPRIEGLFARIERWTARATGEIHWRSISRDNITTLYGRDNNSRIFDPEEADPDHPTRIFSWLICQSYDDKGNAIVYQYKAEDSDDVLLSQVHEKNRTDGTRSAQRYPKTIKYGNRVSRLVEPDLSKAEWLFEVVFDYGEGHLQSEPTTPDGRHTVHARLNPAGMWPARPDAFSSYRSGFEVRTYRLCERILMLHHFPDELGVEHYLVRSTEFGYDRDSIASFITSVTQSGYVAWPDAANPTDLFLRRSLPPVEFEYSKAVLSSDLREVDPKSLENVPGGVDGKHYQWVDLDGEGLSGILTEQGNAWFYKRNFGEGHFGPVEPVARIPAAAHLSGEGQHLLDLSGNGQLDLAEFTGSTPGFYQRTPDEDWESFTPFRSLPRIDWGDPNLRFADLTGDGHADVLIAEDCAFRWHPSLAEEGFGPEERRPQPFDEELGPRLVFADGTQSIYLADLSGDGLSDLVRIRNGEVCYWPNLGYGSFGARVTMDNSPLFDHPDLFDQRQVRLADIDGSGLTDIIYLQRGRATIYRNLSGNHWGEGETLTSLPPADDLSTILVADLLGTGTACLVWSSPLPNDSGRSIRFIDLLARGKPHLLIASRNNLGGETRVDYAPSTRFYLADQLAGRPWITKLPFPVHCVAKVTISDKWRDTRFVSTYSYHHGHFDGVEREFRGFGRVEQVDVESFGTFAAANVDSPYISDEKTLYQPPVKTITWFHTGAGVDRQHILTQYQAEYFPRSLAAVPGYSALLSGFNEKELPEPDLEAQGLSADEWREALRACKGMALRQEIYELDVERLEIGEQVPVRIFSAATHNCHVRLLQPKGDNPHAVFLVTESEALSYHYELDLRSVTLPARPETIDPLEPDPRVAHTLNLSFDELANVRQAVAVGYPRVREHQDSSLAAEQIDLIREVQRERHLAYTETHYTRDVPADLLNPTPVDDYRLRLPCEVQSFELTGISPARGFYFDLAELRGYNLSETLPDQGTKAVLRKQYHELPQNTSPAMRLVEHARTLFFKDDLTGPLGLGQLGRLGLTYEHYKLALTNDLLDAVFTGGQLDQPVSAGASVRDRLNQWQISGYLSDADATTHFGRPAAGEYWIRSGIAGFASDADEHFYLPEKYTDPFDNPTTLNYDAKYDLFVQSSSDARGNTTKLTRFDYRVLAPAELEDVNANHSEAYHDALGRVIAVAVKGKGAEGDNLVGYTDASANLELTQVLDHFDLEPISGLEARDQFGPILGNASSRHLYHFGEAQNGAGNPVWLDRPPGACAILRERHVGSLKAGDPPSPLQIAFECSDGTGTVLMKRSQAEPEQAGGSLRWIVNGKTVFNNKGKPVKQYEPYFSAGAGCCAEGDEHEEVGVTQIMYYDAVGRLVRTEMPDRTLSRVELSPWLVQSFDANDTVLESRWYQDRGAPPPTDPEPSDPKRRAAWLAAHHAGTPALTILDSLGRDVIKIAHNKYTDSVGTQRDEKYLTYTKLDAEGKPLWVRDARSNLVMQYIAPPKPSRDLPRVLRDFTANGNPNNDIGLRVPAYDIAGNLLYQHSMDGGNRWMLIDAAGKPMFSWDYNERQEPNSTLVGESRLSATEYDSLHRPSAQWLSVDGGQRQTLERFEYSDRRSSDGTPNSQLASDQAANRVGQLVRRYDASGLTATIRRDFKGNVLEVERRLNNQPTASLIDWTNNPSAKLEAETFRQLSEYDALNRVTLRYNWHRDPATVAAYQPRYNERGALRSEKLRVRASYSPAGPAGGTNAAQPDDIRDIRYNAKGQKEYLDLGNGTLTQYEYDTETFRLKQIRTTRPADAGGFPGRRSNLIDANIVQQLLYQYDPTGNITEIEDQAYKPVFFANGIAEPKSLYEYDALYRLVRAAGRESAQGGEAARQGEEPAIASGFPITDQTLRRYAETYQYDEVGNLVTVKHTVPADTASGWTRHYECFADSNRLHYTWTGSDRTATQIEYRYDTHGNMLNLLNVTAGQFLRWDHRDMIGSIDRIGGGAAHYQYDAAKQRTRKLLKHGIVEERIYLGGYELYRKTSAAGVSEEIESHHLFEGEERVLLVDDVIVTDNARLTTGPLFRYQYSNHLGSACLELSDQREIISYEEFHPYGTSAYRALNSRIEAPPKRYRYGGMERDEESGLSYHSARHYAAGIAQWVSPDPTGIASGVNRYEFANSAPTVIVDPTGLAGEVFEKQGTGYQREGMSLNVDERKAVGEPNISKKESMRRALDNDARNFELSKANQYTKHNFAEVPGSGQVIKAKDLPEVSLKKQPSAVWRAELGTVKEWKVFAAEVMANLKDRLKGVKEPGEVKAIINSEIIASLKTPTSESAKIIKKTLEKQTGRKIEVLFQSEFKTKVPWGTKKFKLVQTGLIALVTAGVLATSSEAAAATPNQQGDAGTPDAGTPSGTASTRTAEQDALLNKAVGSDIAGLTTQQESKAVQDIGEQTAPEVQGLWERIKDMWDKATNALAGDDSGGQPAPKKQEELKPGQAELKEAMKKARLEKKYDEY
jgi:RHS repeat-associated protein